MSKATVALGDAGRTAIRFDRSKMFPGIGVRAAVGIAIPLAVGQLTGHTVSGVTASIGALNAGFASLQGTYRSRALIVMAATAATAFAAFVGSTVGHLLGVDILVTGVLGFAAGLLVCLGQSALVVGTQTIVGMLVFSQFSFGPLVALRNSGLVLLGGTVQMLLVVVVWPLRRFPVERRALSRVYGALAAYSRSVITDATGLGDPALFDRVELVLRDPQPFGGEDNVVHQALAGQAERIRLELVALARARDRLISTGDEGKVATLDQVLDATALVLDEVALAVGEAMVPDRWEAGRDEFENALAAIKAQNFGIDNATVSDVLRRADALAGQLRTVIRLAAVPAGGDPAFLEKVALTGELSGASQRRSSKDWFGESYATLQSNLTLSSQAFRHALRLAVTLAVAVAISHFFALQHRYWLPLTAMLVLRPDFGSTFSRGISRVLGTLVGAGFVTVILAELRPSAVWLSVLVVLFCFAATALIQANYAIYSVCVASLVVCLLAFTGAPGIPAAGSRSLDTVLGATLALIVYAVWPTWESSSLPETLAGLIETEGRYTEEVLTAWADPERADRAALQRARQNARLSRSNAEAAVGRWLGEPHQGDLDDDEVLQLMAAVRTWVRGLLALHADLPVDGSPRPELAPLIEGAADTLESVAATVRSGKMVTAQLPALRDAHTLLLERLGWNRRPSSMDDRAVTLAGETDLIVNSVNTLVYIVGLQTG